MPIEFPCFEEPSNQDIFINTNRNLITYREWSSRRNLNDLKDFFAKIYMRISILHVFLLGYIFHQNDNERLDVRGKEIVFRIETFLYY